MMDSDEREIYYYLKSWKLEFISARDICRRAGGKKRFRSDEEWAKPILVRMMEKGIIETNTSGQYRLKPIDKNNRKNKRWVSPQIARLLKESGKDFNEVITSDNDTDVYYNSL